MMLRGGFLVSPAAEDTWMEEMATLETKLSNFLRGDRLKASSVSPLADCPLGKNRGESKASFWVMPKPKDPTRDFLVSSS